MTKEGYFNYQAKLVRRDIKNGSYSLDELPEVIAGIWRDDEDEIRRSYSITSLSELSSGIYSKLKTAKKPSKAMKKPAKAMKKPAKESGKSLWCPWWCK